MKLLRVFLGGFLVLFLFVAVVVGTQWGLVLIQKSVNSFGKGIVSIGSVEGRLATSYILNDINIEIPGTHIGIEKFQWQWRPLSLLQGALDVTFCKATQLDIKLEQRKVTAEKETDDSSIPVLLPLKHLLVHEMSIDGLDVKGEEGDLLFQLFNFTASLDYQNDLLVVNSFNAEGPEIGLAFHGKAELKKERNLDLIGDWKLAGYGFHPSKGTFSLSGPIDSLGVNVSLHEPGEIHVVGVIKNLLDAATWTADLDAKNINLETWILHCPEIILSTVHGDMSGDFGHYRGLVVADGFWGIADNLQLRSDIDGDGLGIVFSSLRIDRKDSSAVATNASISWAELFSWEADLTFNNFALDMFFPDFDGSISSAFHSVGDVTDKGLVADFKLSSMNGQVADYLWSAEGSVGLTEERIFSSDLRIQSDSVGGLALVRDVELSWADKLSWKADVDLDHFDPGVLHPMAVGDISGNIKSRLKWDGDLPSGGIGFSHLSGQLRGQTIAGGGEISIDNSTLSTSGLKLSIGDSQLHVNGKVADTFGLQFSFDSPDLSNIGDNLLGELNVEGHLSGSKDSPQIDLDVEGNNLYAGDVQIKTLRGHLETAIGTTEIIGGSLMAEEVVVAGVSLTTADVIISGTTFDHTLTSEMTGPDGELNLTLAGKYDKGWLGKLSGLSFKTTKFGDWTQLNSASLALSADNNSVEDFCITSLVAGSNNSTCLSAKVGGEDAQWSVNADVTSFNLESLHAMELKLPRIKGVVEASVEANGDRKGVFGASTHVTIPEVNTLLSVTDSDFVPVQLKDSSFNAHLEDQNLNFDLFFKDNQGGTLELSAQVQGLGQFDTPFATSSITGKLTLDKYYLSSLSAFTGYGVEPTGWVSSSFGLGGTLGKPEVYGELAIQEGGVELAYQGITLENVVVSVNSRDTSAIVRAGATSDGGRLDIGGVVAYGNEGVEAVLQLTGDNFLLVNLPEYSLRVSPDATMKISKNRGQIKGKVIVPSGLIAPEELTGVVKVSEDVVFLGEEKVHAKNGYPFFLDLDVKLGDTVSVDGYGLKGRLGGDFNVKITPDDFITGRGELDLLDSTFSFYGRSLDIARGRILFTGGPIDNPGMDIRAQKVISAETARDDEYTVGVDISGLVQDLQYNLFSDPYMDDTDILSQMVVGHSFSASSEAEGSLLQAAAMTLGLEGSSKLMEGLGGLLLIDDLHLEGSTQKEDVSLVVGKRITEDLYIGYDMNMFSRLGQFRVRYDLTRGFYVETRSSSESTGADLIYTFRR